MHEWVVQLVEIYGSKMALSRALAHRFGGKPASWYAWIRRSADKEFVRAQRAEQIWTLLETVSPGNGGSWREEAWYKQPVWKVVGLDTANAPRHWYFISPGKARRMVNKLKREGRLVEIALTHGPWQEVDEIR